MFDYGILGSVTIYYIKPLFIITLGCNHTVVWPLRDDDDVAAVAPVDRAPAVAPEAVDAPRLPRG